MTLAKLKERSLKPFKLEDYDVSWKYGFLPAISPSEMQLPAIFRPLQETAALLPKWLSTGQIRPVIEAMPEIDVGEAPLDEIQLRRLMQVYSYLTHAYIWGKQPSANVLPCNIAKPFYQIAQTLGRPPVLSYA